MHSMNYIGRFLSNFKDFYNDINTATLTGAIDVIVVEQPDGTYKCSPFHVRFGKLGVLRSKEKVVDIEINGEPQDIHMKLGESGEAFFVEELEGSENEEVPEHLATSPIPVSEFETLYISHGRRRRSIDLGEKQSVVENQISDFSKRRNTADSERHTSAKVRGRDFLEKQIALGNIGLTETSTEDLTISLPSNAKMSSEDVSKDDYSETIFKMDSLDMDNSKSENAPLQTESTNKVQEAVITVSGKDEPVGENKGGKKKRRKRSLMKKKTLQKKSASVTELSTIDADSLPENVATDRSSLDSNASESELKEMQKYDSESALNTNTRKITLDPDFHFFSDTELTNTTADSRSGSPANVETIQSDTEFEVKKSKDDAVDDKGRNSWAWGQFPSVSPQGGSMETASGAVIEQEQHNSMLTSMFSFMKQSKHRNLAGNEGVYLADISSGAIDPEVAALYFNTTKKQTTDADMDCESGNGPSLTQSPNSPDGCKSVDSDFDEHNKIAQNFMQDISMSMCGWDPEPTDETFNKHTVPFSDICNNPALFESPNLVVRIHDKYYNWKVASPIVSSFIIYQRPLPQSTVDQLCNLYMPASTSASSEAKDNKQETRYSWWSWRRSRPSREVTPAPDAVTTTETTTKESGVVTEIKEVDEADVPKVEVKKVETSTTIVTEQEESPKTPSTPTSDKFKKSLRLSSDQIARLNLHDGMNEVEFSVTTAYQGTTRCKCHLYKWKWDDKIVISDIDGTITKSDVLGHILPIVGKDWAQSGVAQLFNKIKDNGYKLLYLSARAIGQARITRDYLRSIRQGDLSMPDGPILLNPTSLITAFHREVIEKKPEQFKISCLNDIRALFPLESNPFYAGYGNRINDVWAYRAVGIPIVRIFTINPKGELKHELTQTFQSSYSNMSYIVDHLFSPLREAANDYSQFLYWKEPLQNIEELPELV